MFPTAEACQERPLFATRKEMNAACAVFTDAKQVEQLIRRGFEERGRSGGGKAGTATVPPELKALLHAKARSPPYKAPTTASSVVATFRYLFWRFQSGVYVSIRGGRVVTFLSFNNQRFRHPLMDSLRLSPDAAAQVEAYNRLQPDDTRRLRLNPNAASWGTIDCLVSNVTVPLVQAPKDGYEAGHSLAEVQWWLQYVTTQHPVPDCDFFLNRHDMTLLRDDLNEPQLHLTGGRLRRVPRLRPRSLCPIVSFSHAAGHADIPFVCPDDVLRVAHAYSPARCANPYFPAPDLVPWERRRPVAVFRGTATGCGWTVATNARLAASALTASDPSLVDARLTGTHNLRFKKHASDRYVRFHTDAEVADGRQTPDNALPFASMAGHKYVLDLPGNAAAYRLGGVFGLGAVVIVVPHATSRVWFFPLLRHGHNCLLLPPGLAGAKLQAALRSTVRWCQAHDEECRAIARRGLRMFEQHLGEAGMREYTLRLLQEISRRA
jgi:hypothetical protein